MMSTAEFNPIPPSARWFRWAIAFVWLVTGVSVLHPEYRHIGTSYLEAIGLPTAVMYATCVGEVLLGLWVAWVPAGKWITWFQVTLIAGFTVILAVQEPLLLAHPMGVLSKNVPLLTLIVSSWWLQRAGWTLRTEWLLRIGMAVVWITEGLFPKILFQQQFELDIVPQINPLPLSAELLLVGLGVCQVTSAVVVLVAWGPLRAAVLAIQLVALFVLPLLVSLASPTLWVHPFGPLTKNVPIIVGTLVVFLRSTPFLSAVWSNLLIVTYQVDCSLLTARLPPGVRLDTRSEQACLSLVSLDFRQTRVCGVAVPGCRHFPDINLRFYVQRGRQRGVVFLREFVPLRLVAWVARVLYGEPFQTAEMRSTVNVSRERIQVERTFVHSGRTQTVKAMAAARPGCPSADSEEHFLKERYWGFGRTRRGELREFRLEHPRWDVYPVQSWTVDIDWAAVYGPEWAALNGRQPHSVVLAAGSPVRVWLTV